MKKFNIVKKAFYLCGHYFMQNSVYGEYMHDNKRFIYNIHDFKTLRGGCYSVEVLEIPVEINMCVLNNAYTENNWVKTTTDNIALRGLYEYTHELIVRNKLDHVQCVDNRPIWTELHANKSGSIRKYHTNKLCHKTTSKNITITI